ncbi:MAG: hypothetical protein WBV31_20190 [Terriglobales bacterium]
MTLTSAYEDLRRRTIEKIPGIWGRLKYLAELRSEKGGYVHWGFERVHGSVAAQNAFTKAHKTLVRTILRTRLMNLLEDLEQSRETNAISPPSCASALAVNLDQLLPSHCPKETELHLFSVLQTLSILEARKNAGSPVA